MTKPEDETRDQDLAVGGAAFIWRMMSALTTGPQYVVPSVKQIIFAGVIAFSLSLVVLSTAAATVGQAFRTVIPGQFGDAIGYAVGMLAAWLVTRSGALRFGQSAFVGSVIAVPLAVQVGIDFAGGLKALITDFAFHFLLVLVPGVLYGAISGTLFRALLNCLAAKRTSPWRARETPLICLWQIAVPTCLLWPLAVWRCIQYQF